MFETRSCFDREMTATVNYSYILIYYTLGDRLECYEVVTKCYDLIYLRNRYNKEDYLVKM